MGNGWLSLLSFFVHSCLFGTQCKTVVEVGVYLGYTTLALAQAMPQDGVVIGLEKYPEYIDRVEPIWIQAGVRNKIQIKIGDAVDSLRELVATHRGKVDLIYVDADKRQYPAYLKHCLSLIRVGGLIVVDNTLVQGLVVDNNDPRTKDPNNIALIEGIKTVNEHIRNLDPRVWEIVNLPFGDGVTLVLKKEAGAPLSDEL